MSKRTATSISTIDEARALAEAVLDPTRDRVAVVATLGTDASWYVNPQRLAAKLPGAEVYALDDRWAVDSFVRSMPEGLAVFGAAVRLYPVGLAWLDDRYASQFRATTSPQAAGLDEGGRLAELRNLMARVAPPIRHSVSSTTADPAESAEPEDDELDDMAATLHEYEREILRLRKELARLRQARTAVPVATLERSGQPQLDGPQAFRRLVFDAWNERFSEPEKPERPMDAYRIGDDFLASISGLEGLEPAKVASVVMEVITGVAQSNAARAMHRLRSGAGGNAPVIEDEQLGVCWRVNIQTKTASARRLHLWHDSTGTWTLDSVRLHDDIR